MPLGALPYFWFSAIRLHDTTFSVCTPGCATKCLLLSAFSVIRQRSDQPAALLPLPERNLVRLLPYFHTGCEPPQCTHRSCWDQVSHQTQTRAGLQHVRCWKYSHRPTGRQHFYCWKYSATADWPSAFLITNARRLSAVALKHKHLSRT
jgi:hypothetical protein